MGRSSVSATLPVRPGRRWKAPGVLRATQRSQSGSLCVIAPHESAGRFGTSTAHQSASCGTVSRVILLQGGFVVERTVRARGSSPRRNVHGRALRAPPARPPRSSAPGAVAVRGVEGPAANPDPGRAGVRRVRTRTTASLAPLPRSTRDPGRSSTATSSGFGETRAARQLLQRRGHQLFRRIKSEDPDRALVGEHGTSMVPRHHALGSASSTASNSSQTATEGPCSCWTIGPMPSPSTGLYGVSRRNCSDPAREARCLEQAVGTVSSSG